MVKIDLRLLSFATIFKKIEKAINNDTVKTAIRNKTAEYKFADYCTVSTGTQHFTHYKKDGKEIEINTKEIIEQYCKENDIEIIDEVKDSYKITFIPSEKAYKEFDKMLSTVEEGQYKNLMKVASQVKNTIR